MLIGYRKFALFSLPVIVLLVTFDMVVVICAHCVCTCVFLQCFDAVGLAAGRASGL